jgi:hypothetical protein
MQVEADCVDVMGVGVIGRDMQGATSKLTAKRKNKKVKKYLQV